MVRKLSSRRPTAPGGVGPEGQLLIRLSELVGIGDDTVDRLTWLARDGVLTPASAARLAMRHAAECGGTPVRLGPSAGNPTYELRLAGDPFGRFAFRLQGSTAWIVFAPISGVGLLMEFCLRDRIQACLLIGCDSQRRTTVQLLPAVDWRRRLRAFGAGSGRCGSRHVLLLGGLPIREPERSAALAGIECAIRRSGNTELISSRLRKRLNPASSAPPKYISREVLIMIELACPGLVEVPACEEGSAP
ncbi:hypothetical protein Y590_07890 [Methylobacterium sp. AMS5]|nr:hypothetical protein Y590_07890 [Methylobacterium sp. AMS5]